MSAMTDGELLERLGECLLADPARPGPGERQALHRALDEAPAASVVELHTGRQWRRFRRPVAATIAATILLSGSAAAAVETNTLPGPLRTLAVTLGLPVTPGAFTQAQSALSDLTNALAAQDPVAVRADLARLEAALAQLSPSARAELGPGVAALIAQADIFLATQPGATSDEKSSAASRGGERSGRESAPADATGAAGSSGRTGGGDQAETNDSDGSSSASPTQASPSAPTATAPSGPSGGDDTSGGTVAAGTPSPSGVDGDGSSGSSDGGSTTVGSTSASGSDGSGPSGGSDGSDGSGTSGGSDGGSGGSDGGGSLS